MQNEAVLKAETVLSFLEETFKKQDAASLSQADFGALLQGFKVLTSQVGSRPSSWTMEVPVISTSHLTEATARMLTVLGLRSPFSSDVAAYPDGFFYQVGTLLERMPADLKNIHEWALKHDCPWVRFDADGVHIAELPDYEWEAEVERMERSDRYLLWMEDDSYPSLQGPYHDEEARVAAAVELYEGPLKDDGLYRLDVTCGAKVAVEVFPAQELESAAENA